MQEEDNAQDELPCFGNKTANELSFQDPLEEEHEEIANLLEKITDSKDETLKREIQPVMMSNDDSFSNIAPALDED